MPSTISTQSLATSSSARAVAEAGAVAIDEAVEAAGAVCAATGATLARESGIASNVANKIVSTFSLSSTFPDERRAALRLGLSVFSAVVISGFETGGAVAAEAAPRRVVVLPFELIDSSDGGVPFPEREQRLAEMTDRLRDGLTEKGLYRVVDSAEIRATIARLKKRYDLRDCNGCEAEVAKVAEVDRVLVPWVQMVSNLILNVNLEIRDAKSGEALLNKSADIRGNTQPNLLRAIGYILRSMVEKEQGNR